MKAQRRDERLILTERYAKAARAVDERMLAARHRMSLAGLALLRGALDGERLLQAALADLDAARAALREVSDG